MSLIDRLRAPSSRLSPTLSSRRRRSSWRPSLEGLEDRLVLSQAVAALHVPAQVHVLVTKTSQSSVAITVSGMNVTGVTQGAKSGVLNVAGSLTLSILGQGVTTPFSGTLTQGRNSRSSTTLNLNLQPIHFSTLGLNVDTGAIDLKLTANPRGGTLGRLLGSLGGSTTPSAAQIEHDAEQRPAPAWAGQCPWPCVGEAGLRHAGEWRDQPGREPGAGPGECQTAGAERPAQQRCQQAGPGQTNRHAGRRPPRRPLLQFNHREKQAHPRRAGQQSPPRDQHDAVPLRPSAREIGSGPSRRGTIIASAITGGGNPMVAPIEQRAHSTNDDSRRRRSRLVRRAVAWWCAAMASFATAGAADLEDGVNLLRTGRYEECEKLASSSLEAGTPGEDWHALKIRAEVARGKYREALEALEEATHRYPESLRLFLIGRDVRRFNGLGDREERALKAIERQVLSSPRRYATPEGPRRARAVLPPPRRRPEEGARPVLRRRHQASSPSSSTPTSPRPSWPWTSRTTPWRPRRSARRPRPPRRTRGSTTCWPAPSRRGSSPGRDQGAGRGPEDQPAPRRQPAAPGRPADRCRAVRRGGEGRSSRCSRSTRASPGPGPTGRCWPTCANDRDGEAAARRSALAQWADEPRGRLT